MTSNTQARAYRTSTLLTLIFVLITQISAISPRKAAAKPSSGPAHATPFVADDVVLQWNQIASDRMPAGSPFPTGRFMSIVQLSVFEAVNAITRRYEPYLGTISAPAGASPEAAAVAAAHAALTGLFGPSASLDSLRDGSLAAIPDGQAKTDGIDVGIAAGNAMLANRTGDGSSPPMFHTPAISDPYEWQVTPGPCASTGAGVFKHWPNLRPFGIESGSQFRAEPPPTLGSGVYAQAFNEVQAFGDANSLLRPADRTDVARLYAVTTIGTSNSLLRQIASTRDDEITFTARTLAVFNMAINDAWISVFDSKYFYRTWRPVTAIPRAAEDGNKWTTASAFTPLIGTPCFPSYPSAHGSGTNAAITVLERAYGRFGHMVTVSHPSGVRPDGSAIVLTYTDLRDIITDVSDARVYGGIHFRFDQNAGEKQGHLVGQYVYNNLLKKMGGN